MENITLQSVLTMLMYWAKAANIITHGFSNRGMHTTSDSSTTIYWYAALIKKKPQQKCKQNKNVIIT
jgi:hypothetical protein